MTKRERERSRSAGLDVDVATGERADVDVDVADLATAASNGPQTFGTAPGRKKSHPKKLLNMEARVIGIDPGLSGALVVLAGPRGLPAGGAGAADGADGADMALPFAAGMAGCGAPVSGLRVEAVHDLPTTAETTSSGKIRRHIDPVALAAMLAVIGPVDRVIVERLVAPPGISAMSGYAMGATAGTIAAVLKLAGMPFQLVSPTVWKRALAVPTDKEGARQWVIARLGTSEPWRRKMDHNRAEAAAIALWGLLSLDPIKD